MCKGGFEDASIGVDMRRSFCDDGMIAPRARLSEEL